MKTRFLIKDGSTTGTVIWGHNYLNQRRQFAFDGVKFYYQPSTREPFIEVQASEVPSNVILAFFEKTCDEMDKKQKR